MEIFFLFGSWWTTTKTMTTISSKCLVGVSCRREKLKAISNCFYKAACLKRCVDPRVCVCVRVWVCLFINRPRFGCLPVRHGLHQRWFYCEKFSMRNLFNKTFMGFVVAWFYNYSVPYDANDDNEICAYACHNCWTFESHMVSSMCSHSMNLECCFSKMTTTTYCHWDGYVQRHSFIYS